YRYRDWLLVAPNVQSDRIAIEFSFHYFLKLRALTFQFDIRIARDWMIIDRKKDITGLDNAGRWSGCYHRAHENATIVVFSSEKPSLGWILQFRISDPEIGIFI